MKDATTLRDPSGPEAPSSPAATIVAGGAPRHAHLMPLLAAALDGRAGDKSGTGDGADEVGDLLLRDALRERASDVHLEPAEDGWRVRLRIDGCLYDAAFLGHDVGQRLVRHFKALSGVDSVTTQRPQDGRRTYRLDGRDVDLRLAAAPCLAGEKLVLRLLACGAAGWDLAALGMSDAQLTHMHEWLANVHGMVLVVGPTGSGKTTTLYALLRQLRLAERAITTIEDPVEYQIPGVTQMQVNAKAGLTFASAVKAMGRLDSDVLLVGEMREAESARAALDAAGRGRVLLSTLHCRDAVAAVRALRNWGLSDHEIAGSLDVVVAQRLVRVLCPACRREEAPSDADRVWFESAGIPPPRHTWEPRPGGCPDCHATGYRGRTGVFEVWRLDEPDYRLLLRRADELAIRRDLSRRGHRTLLADGLDKADRGITSLEELKVLATYYAPRIKSLDGWERRETGTPRRRRRRRPGRDRGHARPADPVGLQERTSGVS